MKTTLTSFAPRGPARDLWNRLVDNRGAVAGAMVFVAISIVAAGAPYIAPHSPDELHAQLQYAPPFFLDGGTMEFPLGTDQIGRCILSRIIHGARYSLGVGCLVVALSLTVAVVLGLMAAFAGGWVDSIVMRAMDFLLALPSLLLALLIAALLGRLDLYGAMLALAVVYLPHFARLTRAAALTELGKEYVAAARVDGAGILRVSTVTVLPNCMGPLMVQATLSFSSAILDFAALGFLGLGAQPPTPEWGAMLAGTREFVTAAEWWLPTMPGVAILVTVLALNVLGDGLRDALDPRLRRQGDVA